MSVLVPTYPSPYSADPINSAYARIAGFNLDVRSGGGQLILEIYHDQNAALANPPAQPVDRLGVQFGQPMGGLQGPAMPSWPAICKSAYAIQQATPALDPFSAIRNALYQAVKAHPLLTGATDVPVTTDPL